MFDVFACGPAFGLNTFGDYTFVGNSVIPSATPSIDRRSIGY